jgi:hypothetical protein
MGGPNPPPLYTPLPLCVTATAADVQSIVTNFNYTQIYKYTHYIIKYYMQ